MSKLFPNATPRTRAPFRFDIVGSFLRPEALKQARHQCACGECTPEYAEEITDKAVLDLIAKEKKVGLPNVTDGEFRRTWWHLDFLFNLNNVELRDTETYSTKFQAHMHRPVTLVITDKVEWNKDHPFLADFKRLHEEANGYPIKFTIPAPSMLHLITCVRTAKPELPAVYANDQEKLFADITAAYIEAVKVFYDLGCRTLQLDDTSWGEFCSEEKRALYASQGVDVDAVAKRYVQVLNDIRAAAPEDMALTMHICRATSAQLGFHQAATNLWQKSCLAAATLTAFSWNMTATAQGISNHCVSLNINKLFWVWLHQKQASWKTSKPLLTALKKRLNMWTSTNFV